MLWYINIMEGDMGIIELKNIKKCYGENLLFEGVNLEVQKGEFLGIKGESGSGKSTLLNIIGLLEECEGDIIIEGKKRSCRNEKEVRRLLSRKIGYLFQNFALIDDQTTYQNLKIVLKGIKKNEAKKLMLQELEKVGLGDILNKKICQLSGGEQQRVAIVRCILHNSDIILADEPTGSLDEKNTEVIMSLLTELNKKGKTIIMVSHSEQTFQYCSRVVTIKPNGIISEVD